MRFDLHCHTRNGSLDGQIDIVDYVRILQGKGFQGMLVTDHNSYKGYRAWKKMRDQYPEFEEFTVLKGIEYDTLDAGHILVIMPRGLHLRILEVRGLPVSMLIKVVHQYGGILGPAHPYGAKFLSTVSSRRLDREPDLIHSFDFVEAFNTCETRASNRQARELAQKYDMPTFGGSDSHKDIYVGTAYTDIDCEIRDNNDFIKAVIEGRILGCGGQEREEKHTGGWKVTPPVEMAWKCYNKGLAAIKFPSRKTNLRKALNHI